MDRRTFVFTAAQGLLVVPLAALAQQPAKVYRIGVLSPNARESPITKAVHDELQKSLGDLAYTRWICSAVRPTRLSRQNRIREIIGRSRQRPNISALAANSVWLAARSSATCRN